MWESISKGIKKMALEIDAHVNKSTETQSFLECFLKAIFSNIVWEINVFYFTKRGTSGFSSINFPYLSESIWLTPGNGCYIWLLIWSGMNVFLEYVAIVCMVFIFFILLKMIHSRKHWCWIQIFSWDLASCYKPMIIIEKTDDDIFQVHGLKIFLSFIVQQWSLIYTLRYCETSCK